MRNNIFRLKNQFILILCTSILLTSSLSIVYYNYISDILIKKEISYIDITLNQSAQKISSVCGELKKFSELLINNTWTKQLLKSYDPYDKYEYNKSLSNITTNILGYNSNIASISILGMDYSTFGHNIKHIAILNQLNDEYGFEDGHSLDLFTGVYQDKIRHTRYYCYIKSIIENEKYEKFGNNIGTCVLFCNISVINDIISDISLTPGTVYFVLDSSENEIAASGESYDKVLAELKTHKLGYSGSVTPLELELSGRDSLVQIKSIPDIGWHLVAVAPVNEIKSVLRPMLIFSIILLFLMSSCFILIGIRIVYSVTKPVEAMNRFMNKGPHYGLKNRLNIKEKNEFGQLASDINNLLDEIDDMTDKNTQSMSRLYESEIAKNKAQIIALRSQINPHFLYNTLNCIKGYGYLLKSEEIVSITSSLASIMRYSIKGTDIVEVSQEISCIQKYMDIISLRFPGKIQFSFDIPKELYKCSILRFILQPIVENAVYHGLELKPGTGNLMISGWLKDDYTIIFEISDDGVSIPPEQLEKMNRSFSEISDYDMIYGDAERGIGLKNIAHRLHNTYGQNSSIWIESSCDRGTTVTIKYPKLVQELIG